MTWLGTRNNAYEVSVEGKRLGVIKTKEEAQSIYDEIVKNIDNEVGIPFIINETIEVEPLHASKKELTSHEDLSTVIADAVSYNVEAYEIVVDGVSYAIVSSKDEATKILEDIASKCIADHDKITLEVADEVATTDNKETEDGVQNTLNAVPEAGQVSETSKERAKTSDTSTDTTSSTTDVNNQSEATTKVTGEALETKDSSSNYTDQVFNVTISNMEKGEEEKVETEDGQEAQDIERSLESYDFNQDVIIKSCFVPSEDILSAEEAEEILLADRYEEQEYTLVEGDNIWDIAMTFNTTEDRIKELNPEIEDATVMQIGQVIKVEKALPILSITTVEQATFKEVIPGEIQYKPSKHFYEGYTKVIVEGNDGVKELTVEVTKENGEEVSRKTISEEVLKEAKITVIAYGIKEKEVETKPSNSGSSSNSSSSSSNSSSSSSSSNSSNSSSSSSSSGKYIHPLKGAGSISSGYGPRWGTYHYGLDFAASAGTPIYAARAGKVIYSGYNQGGYGKLIILEHSDGTQTYYAHCSSLYVNVGESVGQGERIAGVGTTGDSTGNHLHFEIRINGRPVNPANYL